MLLKMKIEKLEAEQIQENTVAILILKRVVPVPLYQQMEQCLTRRQRPQNRWGQRRHPDAVADGRERPGC